jgi:hypothetical protein
MEIYMRQFIIKQMHKRIMNEDGTANLEYPVWKRSLVVVGGFTALRLWGFTTFAMIPAVVGLGIAVYTAEAIKKIATETFIYLIRDTFGMNYRNLKNDFRGCKNIWNGYYGKGKLLPERKEMKIKNSTDKPTPIID